MNTDCKELLKFGFKAFERKECCQLFLSQTITIRVASITDDYWFRFLGRCKSIAISMSDLSRLPWGQVLFGKKGTVAIYPTQADAPLEMLNDNRNAREACLDLLPKDIQLTLPEMVVQMKKHEAVLLGLCKDFCQEIAFLSQKAEAMGEQLFRDSLLEQLPTAGRLDVKVESVVAFLRQAQTETLHLALGAKFKAEVDNIHNFLSMVVEGNGPKDIAGFTTPFLVQVVDLARLFYQKKVKNRPKCSTMFSHKVIVVTEVARHDMASFRDALVAEGGEFAPAPSLCLAHHP